jgi:hypothetical protein
MKAKSSPRVYVLYPLLSFFDDAECTYLKMMMLSYAIQNGGAHANPDNKRSALEISVHFFFLGTLTNATPPPSLLLLLVSLLSLFPSVCLSPYKNNQWLDALVISFLKHHKDTIKATNAGRK